MVRQVLNQRLITSPLIAFCRDLKKRNLLAQSHPHFHEDVDQAGMGKFTLGNNIIIVFVVMSEYVQSISTLPHVLYAGFDPTSDSLHIGHLMLISNLIRSSMFDCHPIAL